MIGQNHQTSSNGWRCQTWYSWHMCFHVFFKRFSIVSDQATRCHFCWETSSSESSHQVSLLLGEPLVLDSATRCHYCWGEQLVLNPATSIAVALGTPGSWSRHQVLLLLGVTPCFVGAVGTPYVHSSVPLVLRSRLQVSLLLWVPPMSGVHPMSGRGTHLVHSKATSHCEGTAKLKTLPSLTLCVLAIIITACYSKKLQLTHWRDCVP